MDRGTGGIHFTTGAKKCGNQLVPAGAPVSAVANEDQSTPGTTYCSVDNVAANGETGIREVHIGCVGYAENDGIPFLPLGAMDG